MKERQVILNFIDAINTHDIERVYDLLAEDFVFIGAYGDKVHGNITIKQGWKNYFKWFPDYRIEVSDML